MGCVYRAKCRSTGKAYIGMTKHTLKDRMKSHYKHAYGKGKHLGYFQRAIRKYGFDDFEWEELVISADKNVLYAMERYFIKEYHSLAPNGYNTKEGGEGGRPTPDVLAKMSENMQNLMRDNPSERERILKQCRDMNNPECSQKAAQTKKERSKDPEYRERTRKNRSEASKRVGLSPAKDRHLRKIHSDPVYMAGLINRTHKMWEDPEFRQKMKYIMSVPMSDEAKQKQSQIMQKKWEDESYRDKMAPILENLHSDPDIKEKRAQASRKAVYSIETGCFYRSIREAAIAINCNIFHIGDGGTASGLHFEYVTGTEKGLLDYDELGDAELLQHNRIVNNYKIQSEKSYVDKLKKRVSKPIVCVETGCRYSSIKEAATLVGCAPNNMWQAVNKGYGAFGLHYKFAEETDADKEPSL